MITENIKALISYRLEQAEECLAAAKLLFENELLPARWRPPNTVELSPSLTRTM